MIDAKKPGLLSSFKDHASFIFALRLFFISAITVAIFYVIFKNVPFAQSISYILAANKASLAWSLFFLLASSAAFIARWHVILTIVNVKTNWLKSISSIMASISLNALVPSRLGDFARAAYYPKQDTPKIIGIVFSEKIIDTISLGIFLLASGLYLGYVEFILYAIGGLIVLVTGLLIALKLASKRFIAKFPIIQKILSANKLIFIRPGASCGLFLISLLGWILAFIQIYFLFTSLGLKIKLAVFISGIIITTIISMIPITVAGMGTREGAILTLFSGLGSEQTLLAAGLLISISRYWLLSILGLPFVVMYAFVRSKK